jgi:hypothetical protein
MGAFILYKGEGIMWEENSELIKNFTKSLKRMNEVSEMLSKNQEFRETIMKNYNLVNPETLNNITNISSIMAMPKNLDPKVHLKFIDSMHTFRKNIDKFNNSHRFSELLTSISRDVDFNKFKDDTEEFDDDEIDTYPEIKDEEIEIKRPAFFNIAFNINYVINVTDSEFKIGNFDKKEENMWTKVVKPFLKFVREVMLICALTNVPLNEFHIVKVMEGIVDKFQDVQINEELDNDEEGTPVENIETDEDFYKA